MVAKSPTKDEKKMAVLNPNLVRETVKKVDRAMARLQELQFAVTGGNKVISGVTLSPRSTRGYIRTSMRCKQESLRIRNSARRGATSKIAPCSSGEWRRMSLPAMLIGETVGEILQASKFAKDVADAVSGALSLNGSGADDPKTPISAGAKVATNTNLDKRELQMKRKREKQKSSSRGSPGGGGGRSPTTATTRRRNAYVEGGMGSISMAIGRAACEAGAHIVTNAEVGKLSIDENSGRVNGVILADGSHVHTSSVLSNATPHVTFMKLVPEGILPEEFVHGINSIDYSSGTTKINVALDKLPQFRSCSTSLLEVGPQHVGTIHIASESMEDIDRAHRDALNGLPSQRPLIEMTIPSVLDKTISPPGKHVVNLFIQYTPYKPTDGCWQDLSFRESFAQRCFSLIDEYAPGFSSSIIGYDMLAPPDLEKQFYLTGGNIFHGAMTLDSLFLLRPIKGWSNYRSPVRGLYLCGSGAHPGGGVMGAPGRNAAHCVLQDMKRALRFS